ncbi:MAG: nitroreductase [Clostridia bacterium]|nr:nitroreductase [Clostridia bacterium]
MSQTIPNVKEVIRLRKSVRSYSGRPVPENILTSIQSFAADLKSPFGEAPGDFSVKILDAAEHGLKSPVISGADTYFAIRIRTAGRWEAAAGYLFEKTCLYVHSLGLGTVILAGTFNREAFESAMELAADEKMPVASPVGFPAARRSVRETMMRTAIKADSRLPFGQLFFKGDFDTPLAPDGSGNLKDALEALRLAPSAVNRQPWRVLLDGSDVHFYEYGTLGGAHDFDVQAVDMGIAAAHFDLAREADGITGEFVFEAPSVNAPAGYEYVTTFRAGKG